MSNLEAAFDTFWRTLAPDAPAPVCEYQFAPPRRWRFDRAWIAQRVAVEIQGGTWTQGAHSRPTGYTRDCQKRNAATGRGWRVFYATSDMLRDDPAAFIAQVRAAIEEE